MIPFSVCSELSCQIMPRSPSETGLVLTNGPDSSEFKIFSPRLPVAIPVPKKVCEKDFKFMLVGTVPYRARNDLEIIALGKNFSEAIHIKISVKKEEILMWSVIDGGNL